MATITIKAASKEIVKALVAEIDYGPFMKQAGQMLRDNATECFERATSPDGVQWKPLKRPRPGGKGGDIPLNDNGLLRTSLTSVGAEGNINIEEPRRVEVGTNLDYGPIHNYGDGAGGDYILTPKQAQFLAIPATLEAKHKGGAYPTGSPRNWGQGELEFRWGARGGIAFKPSGTTSAANDIQYYFAKSVAIPMRQYLGISDGQSDEITEALGDYVQARLEEKLGAE